MKRKITWLTVGFATALVLVLAMGLPGKVMSSQNEPKRGGWITICYPTSLGEGWDPVHAGRYTHLHPVLLCLKRGDFYRGPGGSNETPFLYPTIEPHEFCTRGLAKSWEITAPDTVRYHLNEGVRWHDQEPMNGREVTAEDIVWGYQRLLDVKDSGLGVMKARPVSMKAVDKYTFEWTLAQPDMRTAFTIDDWYRISPRQVVEKHGSMDDWKTVVGNGPFMIKEYIAGSKIEYVKNPKYWETDREGRPVPFIDGFTALIITDPSTRLAALRTGKIDLYPQVPWRDAEELMKSNPELKTTGGYPWISQKVQMNVKEGIFSDLRLRRAMVMAIDHQAIVKDYHKGNSVIIPSSMFAPSDKYFLSLEDYTPEARELFEYHPEKAKKLLAEAGYPNGFKTQIEVMQLHADLASLLVAMWSQVGINVEIKVLEPAAFVSRLYGMKLGLFLLNGEQQGPRRESWRWTPHGAWNFSQVFDPKLEALYDVATAEKDRAGWGKEWQEVTKYIVAQVYEHQVPGPNVYNFWHPWVKNYHGEFTMSSTDYFGFLPYIWVDKG